MPTNDEWAAAFRESLEAARLAGDAERVAACLAELGESPAAKPRETAVRKTPKSTTSKD